MHMLILFDNFAHIRSNRALKFMSETQKFTVLDIWYFTR